MQGVVERALLHEVSPLCYHLLSLQHCSKRLRGREGEREGREGGREEGREGGREGGEGREGREGGKGGKGGKGGRERDMFNTLYLHRLFKFMPQLWSRRPHPSLDGLVCKSLHLPLRLWMQMLRNQWMERITIK